MAQGMATLRPRCWREAGWAHVSRSGTGLVVRPHTTLQGRDALQGGDRQAPSRRAMHAGVFAAGWADTARRPRHCAAVAGASRGSGRAVMALAWPLVHPARGPKRSAVRRPDDSVAPRPPGWQTVGPAGVANRAGRAGCDGRGHAPRALHAEEASWHAPATGRAAQRAAGRQRVGEVLPPQRPRRPSRQRTALGVEVVQPWETAGACPPAPEACDQGVGTVDLPRLLARGGTHGGSDSAWARPLNWRGQWRRVAQVAAA
jgi:hypothetical protein